MLTKSHNNYFSIIRIQHSFTHNLTTRKSLSWLLIKLFFPLFLTSLPMCFIHWGTLNNADNKKLKSVCSELKWCLIALCCQLRFNSRSFIVTIQQRAQLVGGYVSGKLFGMYFLCLQQLPPSLSLSLKWHHSGWLMSFQYHCHTLKWYEEKRTSSALWYKKKSFSERCQLRVCRSREIFQILFKINTKSMFVEAKKGS